MSPRSAAVNRQRREATRNRITSAALKLFATRGYASTPVDAIVRAAKCSPGLFYHYFPSKQALLQTLFEESMADVRASFMAADAEPDPYHRLAALLRAASDIVKRHREFWALSYGVRMQREVLAGLGPKLAAWTRDILHTLTRYLWDAGWPDPDLEAALLFAQIDGIHQHYVLDPRHYPLDAVTAALIARYQKVPGGVS